MVRLNTLLAGMISFLFFVSGIVADNPYEKTGKPRIMVLISEDIDGNT